MYNVIMETEVNRVVLAGGDTSAEVCRKLNIHGMRVWREIQPGIPSCITLDKEPIFLVLKSGSFGDEGFILEAFEHLKRQ